VPATTGGREPIPCPGDVPRPDAGDAKLHPDLWESPVFEPGFDVADHGPRSDGFAGVGQSRGGACALLASPAAGEFPLGISASRLLLATTFAVAAVKPIGAGGAVDFPLTVPNQGSLVGQEVYLQAWGLGAGRWTASSGLEIKVCK
jgi:hypothetical protein